MVRDSLTDLPAPHFKGGTVKLILAHSEEDGGWQCVVKDCRASFCGRKDAETHAEREHNAECYMDDHLDIYCVKELRVEILRGAGAL